MKLLMSFGLLIRMLNFMFIQNSTEQFSKFICN